MLAMLSKESAQLLIELVVTHVRVTPDGSARAAEVFGQFQQAMTELQALATKDDEVSS